jgi:hypothetical protein
MSRRLSLQRRKWFAVYRTTALLPDLVSIAIAYVGPSTEDELMAILINNGRSTTVIWRPSGPIYKIISISTDHTPRDRRYRLARQTVRGARFVHARGTIAFNDLLPSCGASMRQSSFCTAKEARSFIPGMPWWWNDVEYSRPVMAALMKIERYGRIS